MSFARLMIIWKPSTGLHSVIPCIGQISAHQYCNRWVQGVVVGGGKRGRSTQRQQMYLHSKVHCRPYPDRVCLWQSTQVSCVGVTPIRTPIYKTNSCRWRHNVKIKRLLSLMAASPATIGSPRETIRAPLSPTGRSEHNDQFSAVFV